MESIDREIDKIKDELTEMGCEEFALFQQEIPGLFMFLGNDIEGEPTIPIHDPRYIFNDEILTVGVKALCEIALK